MSDYVSILVSPAEDVHMPVYVSIDEERKNVIIVQYEKRYDGREPKEIGRLYVTGLNEKLAAAFAVLATGNIEAFKALDTRSKPVAVAAEEVVA